MSFEECLKCNAAKVNLETWINHLSDCHPIPLEWPSDRYDRLTGIDLEKPYTTITDSKKKRKKDAGIPRPLNSFMIFAQYMRRNILFVFGEASNSDISKQLGIVWQRTHSTVKTKYNMEASRLAKIHLKEFPNYKYTPKKKCKQNEAYPPPAHSYYHHPQGQHPENSTNRPPPSTMKIMNNSQPSFQYRSQQFLYNSKAALQLSVVTSDRDSPPAAETAEMKRAYPIRVSIHNYSNNDHNAAQMQMPSLKAAPNHAHSSYNQMISSGYIPESSPSPCGIQASPCLPVFSHALNPNSAKMLFSSPASHSPVHSLAGSHNNISDCGQHSEPFMLGLEDLPLSDDIGHMPDISPMLDNNKPTVKLEDSIERSPFSNILIKEEKRDDRISGRISDGNANNDDIFKLSAYDDLYCDENLSIFSDQLPNLSTWVANGNFF